MTRRVKVLRLAPEMLVAFGQVGCPKCVVASNPLPCDARIAWVGVEPSPLMFTPGQSPPVREVSVYIESATFPEHDLSGPAMPPDLPDPVFRDECPHRGVAVPSLTPHALTLTADQLRELLYDADRAAGRRVTIEVGADGAWGRR